MAGGGVVAALIVRVAADLAQLKQNVNDINSTLGSMVAGAKKAAGMMATALAAVDFGAMAGQAVNAASDIADASQKIGDSAEMTQRLKFAAEQGGASLENVAIAIKNMAEKLGGKDGGAQLLSDLGLSLGDIAGKSPGQVFLAMADAIQKIPDPLRQSDLATDAFGKTATDLLPAIKDGFRQVAEAASVMSDQTVAAGDKVGDKWAEVQGRINNMKAEALIPVLNLFASMPTTMQTAAGGILSFMPSLETLTLGLLAVGGPAGAMAMLTTAGAAVATFFMVTLPAALAPILPMLGPAGWIVAGVIAVIAAWKNWDTISGIVQRVYQAVKEWLVDKFSQLVNWIGEKVGMVTGFFRDMYDQVVGNSYVPDMVTQIGVWFGKLDQVMVAPTHNAASGVLGIFSALMPSVGGLVQNGFGVVKGIAAAFAGDFSGVINGIIAGINLARAAWDGLKRLFGGGEEGVDVNPNRDKFFAQYGGYEGLATKLTAASDGNIAEQLIRTLYAADTRALFNAAQRPIVDLIGGNMFAKGTGGQYLDFGSGQMAMLHGRERVVTEAEGRAEAAGWAAVVSRLDRLEKALPRAFADAVILAPRPRTA